jgi:hypothetical protein
VAGLVLVAVGVKHDVRAGLRDRQRDLRQDVRRHAAASREVADRPARPRHRLGYRGEGLVELAHPEAEPMPFGRG